MATDLSIRHSEAHVLNEANWESMFKHKQPPTPSMLFPYHSVTQDEICAAQGKHVLAQGHPSGQLWTIRAQGRQRDKNEEGHEAQTRRHRVHATSTGPSKWGPSSEQRPCPQHHISRKIQSTPTELLFRRWAKPVVPHLPPRSMLKKELCAHKHAIPCVKNMPGKPVAYHRHTSRNKPPQCEKLWCDS